MYTDALMRLQKEGKCIATIIRQNPLSVFRIIFSLWFIWMNRTILISIPVLLGNEGIPKEIFTRYYKSDYLQFIFNLNDSFFIGLMFFNIFLGIYYAIGKYKRLAMLACWVSMGLIFIRIPISRSIHIPYLGHVMLLSLFIPDPEAKNRINFLSQDFMPKDIKIAAWILLGGTYLASAIFKGMTVEWQSGQALYYIFQDIMPRQNFLRSFLLDHSWILMVTSYAVLLLEGLAWAMMFNKKSRAVLFILSALFHLGILISFRMGELSIGMLIVHVFLFASLFDPEEKKQTNLYR